MNSSLDLEIELQPPKVLDHRVELSWLVSQPTGLYHKNGFYLAFPESVPLEKIPMGLWWTLFILCVHSHWALLRSCTIRLPVRLGPGEAAVWQRLLKSYIDTLDALNPGRQLPPRIELLEGDTVLEPVAPLQDRHLCATAFSGGKDSLAQVGLLSEMGYRPLLVTTTSPMPGDSLHDSAFRARALVEVQRRRGLELIEVGSDCRGTWDNLAPRRWGYRLSLNELSDTLLYTAVLAATGYALGATWLFLASENEVSVNVVQNGIYLQHSHFMYSALTQAAIGVLLRPFGLHYGSLTSSLHSSQVQELVTRRYADLSDLQCSCWQASGPLQACSECPECKRLALVSLSRGGAPADQGVDLVRMLGRDGDFVPRPKQARPHPPDELTSERFNRQIARAILSTPLDRVFEYLSHRHPQAFLDDSGQRALKRFSDIQAAMRREYPDSLSDPGYRVGYLQLIESPMREQLRSILAEQFDAEDEREYTPQLANLMDAIAWVTQPSQPKNASEDGLVLSRIRVIGE